MQSLMKFIITIFFIMLAAYGQISNDNKNNNAQQQDEELNLVTVCLLYTSDAADE